VVSVSRNVDQGALDRGRQALLRGWSTTVTREANLLLVRAKGTRIWDVDGNEYIDCTSQAWSNNIGAGHPNVLAAAAAQAEEIAHAVLVFALLVQRHIVRGMTGGALSDG
jgi:4-aminobutyrate aminotransferase / (S)-3-amino-2-methylpropionate transaminase / 5-aminovalerate transaminase